MKKSIFEPPHPLVGSEPAVRLVAFYLPQFHPVPENDRWWGKGFTEWRNVAQAEPQFAGHQQPRLPADLGYYDLREPEVMANQVRMAKTFGIGGFCFYYYWFGGKRLLEHPLEHFLKQGKALDMPFCLCWANESWSRRWDGMENDVLIAQQHNPDDDIACIEDMARFFRDPRYIHIDGRPVVVIYRVTLLPDAVASAQRWRTRCRELGVGEPYLVAAQSFDILQPPSLYGFDAAVEFPPHPFFVPLMQGTLSESMAEVLYKRDPTLAEDFKGHLCSFPALAEHFIHRANPGYPLFRTVTPMWDNTARRGKRAFIFADSSPDTYERWLEAACTATLAEHATHSRLCFLNAWNEWAEGAYLEPDMVYGYAYLNRTARVLERFGRSVAAIG